MTDSAEWGSWLHGLLVGAVLTGSAFLLGGVLEAGAAAHNDWRSWMCERDGAVLVNDSLCVSSGAYDPSAIATGLPPRPVRAVWRVEEPKREN